jgi:hypothetical protein
MTTIQRRLTLRYQILKIELIVGPRTEDVFRACVAEAR